MAKKTNKKTSKTNKKSPYTIEIGNIPDPTLFDVLKLKFRYAFPFGLTTINLEFTDDAMKENWERFTERAKTFHLTGEELMAHLLGEWCKNEKKKEKEWCGCANCKCQK